MPGGEGLVPGALVRWPSAPGSSFGVITDVDGDSVHVRFDDDSEVKVFNVRSAGIDRVVLPGIVMRLSNGAIGSLQGLATARRNPAAPRLHHHRRHHRHQLLLGAPRHAPAPLLPPAMAAQARLAQGPWHRALRRRRRAERNPDHRADGDDGSISSAQIEALVDKLLA